LKIFEQPMAQCVRQGCKVSVNTRRWVEGDFRPICTDECEAKVFVALLKSRDVLTEDELKLFREVLNGIEDQDGVTQPGD